MDYLMSKEIDGLKADIKASEVALEAEKYSFERILKAIPPLARKRRNPQG